MTTELRDMLVQIAELKTEIERLKLRDTGHDALLKEARRQAVVLKGELGEPIVILESLDSDYDFSYPRKHVREVCEKRTLRIQPADWAVAGLWRVLEIV